MKAWITVFNIMTNDDWYGVLILGSSINKEATIIYCFFLIYIVNYLVQGLVMAILLDGFSKYMEESNNKEKLIEKMNDLSYRNSDSELSF